MSVSYELLSRGAGAKLLVLLAVLAVTFCHCDFAALAQSDSPKAGTADASSSSVVASPQEPASTSAEDLMAEGKRLFDNGLFLESADRFEAVLTDKEAKQTWPEAALLAAKAYLTAARAIESAELRREAIKRFESFEKLFGESPLMEEASFLWGLALFEAGDYFEAEPRLTFLLKRFPDSALAPESEYYLGQILEKSQNYLEAQKRYYRVIEFYRRPANRVEDATFRIAEISELLEKHDLAVKWYLLACMRNRQRCLMDADVLFNRGKAYSALGEHKQAVEQLHRFVNIFPEDTRYDEAMLALAANLTAIDDLKGAAAVLGAVSKSKKPESRAEALVRLASLEQESGKKLTDEGFMTLYKQVVSEQPYSDQAMLASTRISAQLLKENNFQGSLKQVDWFFATYGENRFTNEMLDVRDDAILGLLQSYLDEQEYFDGAIMFEEREGQVRKRSSLSRAKFLAGQLYFGLMGYGRSASLLKETEEKFLSPDDRRRMKLLLSLQSFFEGSGEKAAQDLAKLTVGKTDEVSFEGRCHLVDLLLRQEKVEEALTHYQQLPPDYTRTRFLLSLDYRAGLALLVAKEYSRAMEAFDLYIQFNLEHRKIPRTAVVDSGDAGTPDQQQSELKALDCDSYLTTAAFLEKAKCCAALGQKDEAVAILEQVMQGCEKSPLLHQTCYLMADIKLQQGKSDEAAKTLKKCQELKVDQDVFSEAQTLLLSEIEVKKRLEDIQGWWVDQ